MPPTFATANASKNRGGSFTTEASAQETQGERDEIAGIADNTSPRRFPLSFCCRTNPDFVVAAGCKPVLSHAVPGRLDVSRMLSASPETQAQLSAIAKASRR